MYKNLDPSALELSCSQNELIELTLTHRFGGMNLDLEPLQQTVEEKGMDQALRFLKSAPIKISTARLPVALDTKEGKFRARMIDVPKFVELAKLLKCDTLVVHLSPGSVDLPYHENFQLHSQRIDELAAVLAESDMRLGLAFTAASERRIGLPHAFVATPDGLLAFLKTSSATNLGVVVDVWEWAVGGGSAELLSGISADQIFDVRLSDISPGFDAETVAETDRKMPSATGEIDLVGYLKVLEEIGYEGPLTPAPHPSQLEGKRDHIVRTVAESVDAAKALLVEPIASPESSEEGEEVSAGSVEA
jgi:sugar phosphate isomerase/epimerase